MPQLVKNLENVNLACSTQIFINFEGQISLEVSSKLVRGQSSVEYLFVVALALMMIIPGSVIFYRYSADSQEAVVSAQIYKSGSDLVDTAELIYSIGSNSWQTVELTFPTDVHGVEVYRDTVSGISELVIIFGPYDSHAVFFTRTSLLNETASNCTSGCTIPVHDGINNIRVESYDNGVVRYRVIV